jgi:hypothetical protein
MCASQVWGMLKGALSELLVRSKALSAFQVGASALDGLLKKTALRPSLERGGLILMLHSISERPSPFGLSDSVEWFDRFCELAAEAYDVMPLAELESRRRAGTLPARAMALTFDDGYADNHDLAWPVLRKHGLPGHAVRDDGHCRRREAAVVPARRVHLRDGAAEGAAGDRGALDLPARHGGGTAWHRRSARRRPSRRCRPRSARR